MHAATASALPRDRICSWYEEAQRILPSLASLPANAQCAVRSVIASIIDEDERLGLDSAPARRSLCLTTVP